MKFQMIALFASILGISGIATAQTVSITGVEESSSSVVISIQTDVATPFEVMAGIGLVGQADDDIWIGNNTRAKIESNSQEITIPKKRGRTELPAGQYEAEINFYPRWGAKESPTSTKAINRGIHTTFAFSLVGSGADASVVKRRDDMQRWVMESTAIGDKFSLSVFQSKLGRSETMKVTNRTNIVVAHYFPEADMTIFENTLKGTLVTWRMGRENKL